MNYLGICISYGDALALILYFENGLWGIFQLIINFKETDYIFFTDLP